METPFGKHHQRTVCIYELLGTAGLMFAVVMCAGNALYVVFMLWAMLMIGGGITGGHYNPAVSTGVFLWRRKFEEDWRLYTSMMASQFVGAAIGCLFGLLMIGTFTDEWYDQNNGGGSVPMKWLPMFAPEDPLNPGNPALTERGWTAFIVQVMCTGIFVFIILINKSSPEVAPSQVPALQCLSIALALYAMIHVSVRGGACMNPAVGLVGSLYSSTQAWEEHKATHTAYWWAYFFGPYCGGALAGIVASVHEQSVAKMCKKELPVGLLDTK